MMIPRWLFVSLCVVPLAPQPARAQVTQRIDLAKPAAPQTGPQTGPAAAVPAAQAAAEKLEAEAAELRTRLVRVAQDARGAERRLSEAETAISTLRDAETAARGRLAVKRVAIGQMLAQMQRMGREPPPVLVTRRDDALAMIRSGMLLASFLPSFRAEAAALSAELADLDRVMAETAATQARLSAERIDLDALRVQLTALLEEKSRFAATERARFARLSTSAAQAARAGDLTGALPKFDAEVAKATQLAAYDADLKRGRAVELAPVALGSALAAPDRMRPAFDFSQAKGRLAMPAEGLLRARFGSTQDGGGKLEGVRIDTRAAAQVTAPCDGWIIYAGPFRSYGQLLIINAGGGYHVLLAGMQSIVATEGQFVVAGEPVGTMSAEAAASAGKAAKPSLYVEFRKDARPVDPAPWWTPGTGKG